MWLNAKRSWALTAELIRFRAHCVRSDNNFRREENPDFLKQGFCNVTGKRIIRTLTVLITEFCNVCISVCAKMQYFVLWKTCFLEFRLFNYTN
jgi:hypothetical protein